MARKSRILLVDNDNNVREALEHALVSEQFDVISAPNGAEALQEFGRGRIDILLLDLDLGFESGLDLLVVLRRIKPKLPVVVMAPLPGKGSPAHTCRIDAFMEKPLDLPALFAKLRELSPMTESELQVLAE